MLSYAEHGKIPAQTQGRPLPAISPGAGMEGKASKLTHRPFCGSVFRNALHDKWTTGSAEAQRESAAADTPPF
jgi:hypothetical protein